ncbi:MAG: MFS transporter [Acidimicrobiia bacterium]
MRDDTDHPLVTTTRAPSLFHVMSDRSVRRLILAEFAFSAGVFLQAAVLGKQVYDITGRELDLGLLGLAEFLPAAVLVLVTGAVADRFDRRRVAAIGLFGELLCSLGLLFYARSEPTAVWPIFVISVLFGASRSFIAPAARALPPMVAPDGALPRVIALNSGTWTAAIIVGPAASGILYSIDAWVAYAVSATLIAAGMVGVWGLPVRRWPTPPDPDERPSLHSALEGLRFIRRTPILLAAISLDLFAVLFGGAIALLPAIAEDRLGVGDVAYGWLRAAAGIGAAAMAAWLAMRPITRHVGVKLMVAVAVFGVGTLVLGATTSYVIAFAAIVALSAADMISVFIRSTLVPLVTPDEKRGRVLAVENVFIGASNELGAFESGVVASAVGTPVAVVSGGVGTLIVAVIWIFRFPALRRVDRFDDITVE